MNFSFLKQKDFPTIRLKVKEKYNKRCGQHIYLVVVYNRFFENFTLKIFRDRSPNNPDFKTLVVYLAAFFRELFSTVLRSIELEIFSDPKMLIACYMSISG